MNGIINVYKPRGFTSFDVVAKLRGLIREKKIGHTGTLDPEAVGVLPVCVGNATKVCELLTDKDKVYETVMHLGLDTDTQDFTGEVLADKSAAAMQLSEESVIATINHFVGDYDQIPPMYSALKVDGKKLCDLARKGIEVERKPRPVKIFSIDIIEIKLPLVKMRVHCSKGTYIRTLCSDIGNELGVGACMDELERVRVSIFTKENAHSLEEIQRLKDENRIDEILMSVEDIFTYRSLTVTEEAMRLLANGNRLENYDFIQNIAPEAGELFKVYTNDNKFFAVYEYDSTKDDYKIKKFFGN